MIRQRPLSPFEIRHFDRNAKWGAVPKADVPLFASSTVRGDLDLAVLGRVLTELASGHALLRAVVVGELDGSPRFELQDNYEPGLEVVAGGDDAYRALINSPQDWDAGLFKARVLQDGDRSQVVLITHHGVCDGRSMFALLDEMWQRYTGHVTGSPLPQPEPDVDLLDAVDAQLTGVISDEEVDGFLAQLRTIAQMTDAGSAPRQLPGDGDGTGDPIGRLALHRIEFDLEQTASLVAAARAQGISVNSLLTGAALAAVRAYIPEDAAVPMICGHAVDMRSSLEPPVAETAVLNCVGGVATPVFAGIDTHPLELAKMVDVGIHGAVEARFPALFMRASNRVLDPEVAEVFAALPTLGMSNIGRVPARSTPAGLDVVRDEVFAMALGMPPKMTMFTIGDRLTIQVEYDTAGHSHDRMLLVTEAMREQVARVSEIEAAEDDSDLTFYPGRRDAKCPFQPASSIAELAAAGSVSTVRTWERGKHPRLVTGHEDTRRLLVHPQVKSDNHLPSYPHISEGMKTVAGMSPKTMFNTDGPEHARFRRMLAKPFTPKRLESLHSAIQKHIDECLDAMIESGSSADLVAALALPVPSRVICELLGVPYENHAFFERATEVGFDSRTSAAEQQQITIDMLAFLNELLETKAANPGEDMLSDMAELIRDGKLESWEAALQAVGMLAAGHETTANMISLSVVALLERPDQLAIIRDTDDPKVLNSAVDELMRFMSIVDTGLRRVAVEDIEVGDDIIRAGEGIVFDLAAANWDPAAFENPEILDVQRENPNPHVAFGYGHHHCIGMQLARTELGMVLQSVFRRLPELRVVTPIEEIDFKFEDMVYGMRSLPVEW
ncbi:cytochrome P450 [Nocardia sp. NPDC005978]|uniref:cytochrome P450 n=1 Tax=Nocardia sp. NPDC005978 TaxID=3156725 RepID=UPI0033A46076